MPPVLRSFDARGPPPWLDTTHGGPASRQSAPSSTVRLCGGWGGAQHISEAWAHLSWGLPFGVCSPSLCLLAVVTVIVTVIAVGFSDVSFLVLPPRPAASLC